MRNNTFAIMKKELSRFFTDKRMLLSTILLPGVMIYLIYTFMGDAMSGLINPSESALQVAVVNMPASLSSAFAATGMDIQAVNENETEDIRAKIAEQDFEALVIFPQDFDTAVSAYDIASGNAAPDIAVYYNSSSTDSQQAYSQAAALLDQYEAVLTNKFDVNAGKDTYDLASEKDLSGMIYSMMMPMLLITFLFSACLSIGPESIAGEKERGTLSTLLVTPLRRSQLAIGKILALSIIALLSAISSTVGTLVSLPKLMGGAAGNQLYYTISDYLMLTVVILSTVLIFISLVSIISAFAKTIKEAQTYISPLMVLVMLIGVSGMFTSGSSAPANFAIYLIPVYNSVRCMNEIFSYQILQSNILICTASNLVYSGILAFVLTKMFNSEKIMFSR